MGRAADKADFLRGAAADRIESEHCKRNRYDWDFMRGGAVRGTHGNFVAIQPSSDAWLNSYEIYPE